MVCTGATLQFGRTEYLPSLNKWNPHELKIVRDLCGWDVITCSDLNAHHHCWGSQSVTKRGRLVAEQLAPTGFVPLNTREAAFSRRGSTQSLVDITFASERCQYDWAPNQAHGAQTTCPSKSPRASEAKQAAKAIT